MTSPLTLIGFLEFFVAGVAIGLGMAFSSGLISLFRRG